MLFVSAPSVWVGMVCAQLDSGGKALAVIRNAIVCTMHVLK